MDEHVKIGSTHFRYVEISSRTAYAAKFHEYQDGSKLCLAFEFGWPLLMKALHTYNVQYREGYDAFYSPDLWLEDMDTEAKRRGYREAESNYNCLLEAERMERRDREYIWQW